MLKGKMLYKCLMLTVIVTIASYLVASLASIDHPKKSFTDVNVHMFEGHKYINVTSSGGLIHAESCNCKKK